MFILQLPPISLIHKVVKKPQQGKLFIEPFFCILMVEEKLILKEIWKNQEALITFLRGQDARHGYSEYLPTLN